MQDALAALDFETVMEETTITADKTDMTVIDLDSFGKAGNPVNGCLIAIHLKTLTTITAAHYFTPKVYQADAKTSATALTSGELCTSDEVLPETIEVIDDGVTAGNDLLIAYRGVKPKIQLQLIETGTASMVVSVSAVGLCIKKDHTSKTTA